MTGSLDPRLRSNPFATRFTRPGAIEFLFPDGQSPQTVVAALRGENWWGEIVGPHGSGKSTLLAALLPELVSHDRQVVRYALSQGDRTLTQPEGYHGDWNGSTQVVVDGYEQLSWWSRRRLQIDCRKSGSGLLVTTHRPGGLPRLFQTSPSLELAQTIVQRLLPEGDQTIQPDDVSRAFSDHPTDLREMLFRLYDLYQSRQ